MTRRPAILLVDDDANEIDVALRAIDREGVDASVSVARDGVEALETLGLESGDADIEAPPGYAPTYPLIGDPDLPISKLYGMLPAETPGSSQGRTAADNQTVRNVIVIGPDKKVKLIIAYPMTTGRNFDEVLRVIDSLQLTAKHRVATPVNWRQGGDVIIAGSVTDEEAKAIYPQGWQAPKP